MTRQVTYPYTPPIEKHVRLLNVPRCGISRKQGYGGVYLVRKDFEYGQEDRSSVSRVAAASGPGEHGGVGKLVSAQSAVAISGRVLGFDGGWGEEKPSPILLHPLGRRCPLAGRGEQVETFCSAYLS